MILRRLHAWLAILAAPTILFFALTGALQLFDLHEPHGAYRPPLLVEELGRLHKDQIFAPEPRRHATPAPEAQTAEPADPLPVELLRWVFLAATVVLCLSTALGLWIGLRHLRRTRTRWILLLSGAAVPFVLACL